MANKLTQKDYFGMIIELAMENERQDLVEFCEGRITQLEKKTSSTKSSKTQIANEPIKARVLEILATSEEGMTCSDVIKSSADMRDFSTQKISGIMKILISENKVEKKVDGKKSLFVLA